MIDSDNDKKARGKRTRRLAITTEFVEITECMESMKLILNELRVISLSEVKHEGGVNLPYE